MKIGISTSVIQRGKGGVGQYVLALVRALLRHSNRCRLVLYVLTEDLPLFDFAKNSATLVAVPERFRPPVKNILWHQWKLPRLAREHELDVLHIPSYRRLLGAHPCATVATIHDLAPFRVPEKYDWKRMFYGRHVVKALARRVDEIIAVSENTARDIRQFFGLPANKISVVHNGIDHDRFNVNPASNAPPDLARFFKQARPFFLYVARLEHPAKNHVRLISAFNRFKGEVDSPWKLVLAGSDWHGADVIHAAIRQSPFAHDIHCLGFVPDEHLPQLYQAADIFIYPSLYEGFGLPPIEAMACGRPVICSTRGALREVVGNAAALVNPESVAAIQWQMTRFARDAELRQMWGEAGVKRAKNFDWEKSASATLQVYTHAAESFKRCGNHATVKTQFSV